MRLQVLAGAVLAAALMAVVLALVPSTDDFDLENPLWNGMSGLASMGARPARLADSCTLPGSSTLLLVGPSKGFTRGEVECVRRFLERGGLLLVLDDYGTSVELLRALGLRAFLARGVLVDELYMYRSPALPRVKLKLLGAALEVYFNYGTVVRGSGACVGRSTAFSFLDLDGDLERDPGEPEGPLCTAMAWRVGRGAVVLVADSSLFINSMLSLEGNAELARLLASRGELYVVVDKWVPSTYKLARALALWAARLLLHSEASYPAAALAALASFAAGRALHRRRRREEPLEELVRRVLARHPTWDEELVRRLAEEVLRVGGAREAEGAHERG